ncbi:uncharacterized protein N7506_004055 [Penicillium brevicompactum]|uniref:uncharacterized protein n=1 Tax=Penicillium brevicompactum TaxID=5074 RepID=UPI002542614F|nr:uncharacterized protein N7506_004055 [Penicillium brevicompactum]KAJ5336033.1 hypothetical protein N7506_004055 [Penicillium brevicompactum]
MIVSHLFALVTVWQVVRADSDSCSNSLIISTQSDVNNLTSCENFEGSITIDSSFNGAITLSGVEQIKGSFIAEGVSGLSAIVAPDLDKVQGSITISNLDTLSTITMGALSQVSSGMTITRNPQLRTLGFQQLEEVDGQLTLTGSFTTYDSGNMLHYDNEANGYRSVLLPALDQVQGQTIIKTSGSTGCSALNSLKSKGVFRGSYSCSEGSSGLSSGAKAGIAIGVILAVLLILVALWFILRRRRRNQRALGRQPTDFSRSIPSPVLTQTEKTVNSTETPSPIEESQLQMPRKPVGSAIFLDSRSIHEAPIGHTPVREYYELDAGPVSGSHQRPINAEN